VKALLIALLLASATAAHADASRCDKGKELAQTKDLPRAALYLDSCTDDDGIRIRNSVAHKLEATQLSPLTITSLPDGLPGESTAMPGEPFTTPATIWVKAGTYKITVGGQTVEKTVEAHSRTSVIINAPPPPKAAKNGTVSFEEEPEQHQGAPPAVKHGSLMPKKYLEPERIVAEDQLDDPCELHESTLAWRLGLRAGGGVFDRTHASAGFGFSLAALAERPLAGPALLATRLDWSHTTLDTIGGNVGVAVIALARPSFVLSAGAAMRAEVRVQSQLDTMDVARFGLGGAADLDLAILPLPLALGLRVEQGFTELMPGVRNRAALFELGYDWR
jgi:hypothetical protein